MHFLVRPTLEGTFFFLMPKLYLSSVFTVVPLFKLMIYLIIILSVFNLFQCAFLCKINKLKRFVVGVIVLRYNKCVVHFITLAYNNVLYWACPVFYV